MMPQTFFCRSKGLKMLPFPMKCFDWSSPNFKNWINAPLTISFASVLHHNGIEGLEANVTIILGCPVTFEPIIICDYV